MLQCVAVSSVCSLTDVNISLEKVFGDPLWMHCICVVAVCCSVLQCVAVSSVCSLTDVNISLEKVFGDPLRREFPPKKPYLSAKEPPISPEEPLQHAKV